MHWAAGSVPRAWAGLFTAEASFTARTDFELFSLFFLNQELEILFYSQSHMWCVSLIPGQPMNVFLRSGKTATEKAQSRLQVLV